MNFCVNEISKWDQNNENSKRKKNTKKNRKSNKEVIPSGA